MGIQLGRPYYYQLIQNDSSTRWSMKSFPRVRQLINPREPYKVCGVGNGHEMRMRWWSFTENKPSSPDGASALCVRVCVAWVCNAFFFVLFLLPQRSRQERADEKDPRPGSRTALGAWPWDDGSEAKPNQTEWMQCMLGTWSAVVICLSADRTPFASP